MNRTIQFICLCILLFVLLVDECSSSNNNNYYDTDYTENYNDIGEELQVELLSDFSENNDNIISLLSTGDNVLTINNYTTVDCVTLSINLHISYSILVNNDLLNYAKQLQLDINKELNIDINRIIILSINSLIDSYNPTTSTLITVLILNEIDVTNNSITSKELTSKLVLSLVNVNSFVRSNTQFKYIQQINNNFIINYSPNINCITLLCNNGDVTSNSNANNLGINNRVISSSLEWIVWLSLGLFGLLLIILVLAFKYCYKTEYCNCYLWYYKRTLNKNKSKFNQHNVAINNNINKISHTKNDDHNIPLTINTNASTAHTFINQQNNCELDDNNANEFSTDLTNQAMQLSPNHNIKNDTIDMNNYGLYTITSVRNSGANTGFNSGVTSPKSVLINNNYYNYNINNNNNNNNNNLSENPDNEPELSVL